MQAPARLSTDRCWLILALLMIPGGGFPAHKVQTAGGNLHLATIVMFKFVPIFIIVALLMTFFFHRAGHIYAGAFTSALLVTWTIVAGQATHCPY